MKTVLPLIFLLIFVVAAWSQAPNGTIPSSYAGMTIINPPTFPSFGIGNYGKESAAEWGYIEPNPPSGSGCPGTTNCNHTYNWSLLDSYVATAASHNIPFMWTWDYAPAWATGQSGCGSTCTGNIKDLVDMDAFVKALVTRYNGQNGHGTIQAYETGNEIFSSGDFTGTIAQEAAIVNRIVADIRSGNPNAIVGSIGEQAPDYYYMSGAQYDQLFAAGMTKSFDFISFHGYPHHSDDSPEYLTGPCAASGSSDGHGEVACIKAMMSRNGIPAATPIWMTEGGWGDNSYSNCVNATGGGSSSTGCNQASTTLKAAFVSRYMLELWSSGVSSMNWYAWDNSGWGSLGAASTAFQQTYNWMVGSTMTSPCAVESGTIWTCAFTRSGGASALAVWDTSGSGSFTVPSGFADYLNLSGTKTATSAGATITIGIQPVLLEGTGASTGAPAPPTGLTAIVN